LESVASRHYFLVSFVDAFSRYIVHHRLLTELSGTAVSVELEAALASCTGAKPRIADDHGSEFRNAELRAVIKAHDLIDICTRARHPECNGIVERWNCTVRGEREDYYGDNYLVAQRKVQQLANEYNNVRLHAALGYFEPRGLRFGNPNQRGENCAHKLVFARHQRRVCNRSQMAD
jgi:transposase InsO family protein